MDGGVELHLPQMKLGGVDETYGDTCLEAITLLQAKAEELARGIGRYGNLGSLEGTCSVIFVVPPRAGSDGEQ